MSLPLIPGLTAGPGESMFLGTALFGGLVGSLIGGLAAALTTYLFSRKLFKSKVLDNARKDIKVSLSSYMEWLTTVSGEFALWKTDLIPAYIPDSDQDQFELNRMRRLFVDQRNQLWLAKLEEYDTLLEKFNPAIKAMWFRQMELHEGFSRVFKALESDPPEAVKSRRADREPGLRAGPAGFGFPVPSPIRMPALHRHRPAPDAQEHRQAPHRAHGAGTYPRSHPKGRKSAALVPRQPIKGRRRRRSEEPGKGSEPGARARERLNTRRRAPRPGESVTLGRTGHGNRGNPERGRLGSGPLKKPFAESLLRPAGLPGRAARFP